MMRGKAVVAEKPRLAFLFADKLDRLLGAPGRLVVLLGDAVLDVICRGAAVQFLPRGALFVEPLRVSVFWPVRLRVMRPMEHLVPVIDPCLDHAVGAGGQVQFPGQAAGVAGVCKQATHQFLVGRHRLAVLSALGRARIATGHERGPARRADRTLGEGMGKRHAAICQAVDARGAYVRVSQRAYSVVPLLVGADPKYVRARGGHRLQAGTGTPACSRS